VRHERDQLQGERNRLVLQKNKLETLCRELQKQNKIIQEENLSRTRAEEDKRREVADHFQISITSIQNQLNEYQTRNVELRKENQDLADKLGHFIQQHEKREEHVEKVMHARELEVKLAEAKLNKVQCLLDQERVKSQQKVNQMEEEARRMKERMEMHLTLENKLKEQIEFYKNKYQSFNKTISQSNKLFENARTEMDKLGKRVKQSERDVIEWQGKWELSQRSLLEVVAELKKKTEEAAGAQKQSDRLASLCRALQAQLTGLRQSVGVSEVRSNQNLDEQGDSLQPEQMTQSEKASAAMDDLTTKKDETNIIGGSTRLNDSPETTENDQIPTDPSSETPIQADNPPETSTVEEKSASSPAE
ncbi:Alpha-taxilin, partial [Paragonimus heterotremus]